MKCGREFSDQRKKLCSESGGMRPAEESGIMGARLLYPGASISVQVQTTGTRERCKLYKQSINGFIKL